MRRETFTCRGCYGTNSVLAVKINIVLEISINSTSSAARRKRTDDLKLFQNFTSKSNFSFSDQLISYFPIQGYPEKKNKERKHLPAIRKGKTERKWGVNEERCKLYEDLNLGHDHI